MDISKANRRDNKRKKNNYKTDGRSVFLIQEIQIKKKRKNTKKLSEIFGEA
jgi:hypothetical protein